MGSFLRASTWGRDRGRTWWQVGRETWAEGDSLGARLVAGGPGDRGAWFQRGRDLGPGAWAGAIVSRLETA